MFGYIKPRIGELRVKEHELYKAVYCGLCRTERKKTGLFSCFALSYDFVFLYLLRSEVLKSTTAFKTRKNKRFHKNNRNVAVDNPQLSYCAAVSALLSYLKLQDDAEDENFTGRLKAKILLPYARHSLKKAKKVTALPEKELAACISTMAELEKSGAGPDAMAEQSGKLLSVISCYGVENELSFMALERIGQAIGKWLYLIDAADDFKEDLQKNRFTPFDKEGPKTDILRYSLDAYANDADEMLSKIPVFDTGYRAILKNILFYGMHDETNKVIDKHTSEKKG